MRRLRWPILCLPLLLVGCALFTRDPGPDGKHGTADDGKSRAEKAADDAADLAGGFGYGWIGSVIQGLVTAASVVATARK